MRTLPEAVTLLADSPTVENREIFIRTLMEAELGAPLPAAMQVLPSGTHRADGSSDFAFPNTSLPDGTLAILTWCDIPEMNRQSPDQPYFSVDARVVLQMAQSINGGVIVQCQTGPRPTWAGLSADDVVTALADSGGG